MAGGEQAEGPPYPAVRCDDGLDEPTVRKATLHDLPPARAAPPPSQFHTPHVLNLDGTTTTHYPDGTQDVRAPDGRCWRIAPNGNIVHAWQEPPIPQWHPPEPTAGTQPDGGTVVYYPDGSKELWRDGLQTMLFDPEGHPAR
ncbi:MAG TPA: hypothetical protein VGL21_02635 [Jatrophihabitantaceae bacterium]|jgi:hypothetical protein